MENYKRMKVLNTRSTHQAKKLTSLLESNNIDVVEFPLLAIKPVAFYPIKTDDFDIIIFTSQNAVTYFYAQQPDAVFLNTVIAMGPATQAALENNHVTAIMPAQFNSEGMLALDIFRDILGKKIAIISGENPKLLLHDTLIKRDAIVNTIFCYRREPIHDDMSAEFSILSAENIDVIIVTSSDNYQQLLRLCSAPIHRQWLLSTIICVTSDTLKQTALSDGFQTVFSSKNATDEAIVYTISHEIKSLPRNMMKTNSLIVVIAIVALIIAISAIFMTGTLLKKINHLQTSSRAAVTAPSPTHVNAANTSAIFSRIAEVNQSIQQLSETPKTQSIVMQAPKQSVDTDLPWYKRFLHSFTSLKNLFLIRRMDADSVPLITPKEASLIKQNISAQLTIAQLALLKHDAAIYQLSLKTASQWLTQYFPLSDATQPLLKNLTELQTENLQPVTVTPKSMPKKPGIGVEP